MKLTYRGVSYEVHPTQVEVAGKKNVIRFRGCSYETSKIVMNLKQPSKAKEITYRGVSLANGKKGSFLGQTYQQKEIIFAPIGV